MDCEIRKEFEERFGISTDLPWPTIREILETKRPELFENQKPVNFFLRFLRDN
jgi:hypothetical protein